MSKIEVQHSREKSKNNVFLYQSVLLVYFKPFYTYHFVKDYTCKKVYMSMFPPS